MDKSKRDKIIAGLIVNVQCATGYVTVNAFIHCTKGVINTKLANCIINIVNYKISYYCNNGIYYMSATLSLRLMVIDIKSKYTCF